MPDKAFTVPSTGETVYRHITSGQSRLMSKQKWQRTVRNAPNARVTALAAELGATVNYLPSSASRDGSEQDRRDCEVTIEAPENCHWRDGVHEIVVRAALPTDAWIEALDRMKLGVEPCTAECEWWAAI